MRVDTLITTFYPPLSHAPSTEGLLASLSRASHFFTCSLFLQLTNILYFSIF